MDIMVGAVYEQGVLRPTTPLTGLFEGQRVYVVVRERDSSEDDIVHREAELLRRLEADGLLVHPPLPAGPPPTGFRPLSIQGDPLSEEIIRERR